MIKYTRARGVGGLNPLFVHGDLEIEQLEISAAVMQVDGGIDLIAIRHYIDAVAFLISD